MFKGFTGCMLAGAGLIAGAIYGSIIIMTSCFLLGAAIAATSCALAEKTHKTVNYPSYKY